MELQIYNKLLELPLFQGLSRVDMTEILARTKFGFEKIEADKEVVRAGEECHRLFFLLNGTLEIENISDDHNYRIIESTTGPEVLQPERIFGLRQRYTKTYRTKESCNFVWLMKSEVLKLMANYEIFRLNLLNIISTFGQRSADWVWRHSPQDVKGHIIRWIAGHVSDPIGEKIVYIKMRQLAQEVNDSRLDVSKALNEMESEGLIKLLRGRFIVPEMRMLINGNQTISNKS